MMEDTLLEEIGIDPMIYFVKKDSNIRTQLFSTLQILFTIFLPYLSYSERIFIIIISALRMLRPSLTDSITMRHIIRFTV